MPKLFKISLVMICLLLGTISHSFAYNNQIYFQKNATYDDASAYTLDSDTLFVDLWERYYYGSFGWACACCAPNQTVTVTVTGGSITDQVTLTLVDYVYGVGGSGTEANPNKFRNTTGVTLELSTTATPSTSDATLSLEDGQTLNVSYTCGGDSASDSATVNVAYTNSTMVVRNDTNFNSGSVTSGYTPGTDLVYIQVTDTDENAKGYEVDTITVDVASTTAGDSETLTLTETGNNTGIFQYTTGLTLTDGSGAAADVLQVDANAGGDTVTVSYEDNDDATDTASTTINTEELINNFTVSADSSTQIAGTAFTLTITALKSDGTTLTSYSGTVNLSRNYSSPSSGTMDISPTSTSSFTDGVAIVNVTYNDCGTITITATDSSDASKTGTSSSITFLPYDFTVVASSVDTSASGSSYARHTVNKDFTLTVTARNAAGSTTPNYQGTANLTVNYVSPSTSQSGSLGKSSLSSSYWSNGVATITDMTYDKWGTIFITAKDSSLPTQTGTSSNIVFIPKDFSITLSSPPASRTFYYVDEDFSATVKARDNANSAISNYRGTVSFTGSGLNLPSNYTFTTGDAGSHKFSGINGSSETTTTLYVKDTTYTSVTGTSLDITIKSATLKIGSASGPVGKLAVGVTLVDSADNIITEDDSTTFKVLFTEEVDDDSATSETTTTPATISSGTATIYITDNQAERVTITPVDVSPVLGVESGTVAFGTLAGTGIGIELWREIPEPAEYEEE